MGGCGPRRSGADGARVKEVSSAGGNDAGGALSVDDVVGEDR
jgi:hypothetical protein